MSEIKTTGILKDWTIEKRYDGQYVITGKIYDDVKRRFQDGANITTSRLLAIQFEDGYAFTKNSVYKLEDTI